MCVSDQSTVLRGVGERKLMLSMCLSMCVCVCVCVCAGESMTEHVCVFVCVCVWWAWVLAFKVYGHWTYAINSGYNEVNDQNISLLLRAQRSMKCDSWSLVKATNESKHRHRLEVTWPAVSVTQTDTGLTCTHWRGRKGARRFFFISGSMGCCLQIQ